MPEYFTRFLKESKENLERTKQCITEVSAPGYWESKLEKLKNTFEKKEKERTSPIKEIMANLRNEFGNLDDTKKEDLKDVVYKILKGLKTENESYKEVYDRLKKNESFLDRFQIMIGRFCKLIWSQDHIDKLDKDSWVKSFTYKHELSELRKDLNKNIVQ